jgi:energy-coupling factor transporter ATP-binding protein EcfA2
MLTDTNIFNPFPGLRSFEENEDVLFFGREKQVDELVKKLRMVKFLAVIGSSGSGKSSLVKSGLIPALHSGFMAGAGSNWKVCTFRPGNDPIGNMAIALAEQNLLYNNIESEEDSYTYASINESTLRRSSQGLVEVYRQSGIDPKNNLLILVDQFEEIFRFSKLKKMPKKANEIP